MDLLKARQQEIQDIKAFGQSMIDGADMIESLVWAISLVNTEGEEETRMSFVGKRVIARGLVQDLDDLMHETFSIDPREDALDDVQLPPV